MTNLSLKLQIINDHCVSTVTQIYGGWYHNIYFNVQYKQLTYPVEPLVYTK